MIYLPTIFPGIQPRGIANFLPLVWLDSADPNSVQTDRGYVIAWFNKSYGPFSNANNAGSTTTRPTYGTNTVNGMPVITFASGSRFLVGNMPPTPYTPILATPRTTFTVYKNRPGVKGAVWSYGVGSSGFCGMMSGSSAQAFMGTAGAHCYLASVPTGWIGSCTYNDTGGITTMELGSQSAVSTIAPANTPVGQLQINRLSASTYFASDIAEIIIFNRLLNAADRLYIKKILMNKYALPLWS